MPGKMKVPARPAELEFNVRAFRMNCKTRLLCCVILSLLTAVAHASPPAARATYSGYANAHDGTQIYYEVHGTGPRFLLFGYNLQPNSPDISAFVDGLGHDYRLIVAEYPGEPKMYTLTPATVTRDYMEIAKAAGAEEFAFYGYSWGAVCGLQLALRTDRVKALIAGGFPMIGGPYLELRDSLQKALVAKLSPSMNREVARQYLTYYEGLQSFDDQSVQKRLGIPRLNFVGTNDDFTFMDVQMEFYKRFLEHKDAIKAAGWDLVFVQGQDHSTTVSPKTSIQLIRRWLAENWKEP